MVELHQLIHGELCFGPVWFLPLDAMHKRGRDQLKCGCGFGAETDLKCSFGYGFNTPFHIRFRP